MMVLCHKYGLVKEIWCKRDCPDWVNAKEGNKWGNSTSTCQDFGRIIRSEEEQKALGVKYVHPDDPSHSDLSKKMEEHEDRDIDHQSKRQFSISIPVSNYNTKLKVRRILDDK